MMVDPNGFDAVVIVTFDSDHGGPRYFKEVGHIMLLIQDQDGVWWITEFTGSKPRNAKVTTKKLEDYIYHSFYENKENWGVYFTRIRLSGDYTASLDLSRSYADNQNYPRYLLLTNNCLHYVKTIMRASSCSYANINAFVNGSRTIIPATFGRQMEKLMYDNFTFHRHTPAPTRTTPMPW
ncbi:MAG: hypothetical protein M0R06_21805 [Sphaerochaeta sp.]|jgi:hypothetical protein|nr:hypothetical protein [Sphaerochaeta sp.]